MHLPTSRRALLGTALAVAIGGAASSADTVRITIYKTPWCNCCEGWVAHLKRVGYATTVVQVEDLNPLRTRRGIPFELSSCHTGIVGPYVLEGHVPAADVARLLKEQPKALGLVVPGMPVGSPGMELPSGAKEQFSTLLLLAGGKTRLYARHG